MERRRLAVGVLAAGLVACAAPAPPTAALQFAEPRPTSPAPVAAFEASSKDLCKVARADDLRGPGEAELERYAQRLAQNRAASVGLSARDVTLVVIDSEPKQGLVGVIAGEFTCASGNAPPYRITLYRKALEGRQLQVAYHTIAHEMQHIIQIRRDDLRCDGSDESQVERYEREAIAVADRLAPACK